MNSLEHLRHLYAFNDWANRRVITSLKSAPSEKAVGYVSHILLTEKEYYDRIHGKDSTGFDFWQTISLKECGELAKVNAELYERLLAKFDDEGLGQSFRYYTSGGTPFENTFREVLTHVLFHSMNHRGQILTILRLEGFEPPAIDYIVYEREIS